MNLKSLGNAVSSKPMTTVMIILILTSIFGLYASQMHMSADLNTFLPNDEIVNAQKKVSDEFGDTDITEILLISNNTVSKSSLEDMLKIEKALEDNKSVVSSLHTPDTPGESIMSPADVIITGKTTLSFEKELIGLLTNMSANLSNANFSALLIPVKTMDSIMNDYHNIYTNATMLRQDAQVIVLLLFQMPSGGENASAMMPMLENVTQALMYGENFQIKSMFLTMLTPPLSSEQNTTQNMSNPLLNFFNDDMLSNQLSIREKEISVSNFIAAGRFSETSLNYTNTSITEGINENNNVINALNYVNYSVGTGDNATAMGILSSLIENSTYHIKGMQYVLPYYENYNHSISKFLYDLNNHAIGPEDIASVQENISRMLQITSGDEKAMFEIFNQTFENWLEHQHIYYDVAFEANTTLTLAQNFLMSYNSAVQMNYTFTQIQGMINRAPVYNTTYAISSVISQLNMANSDMNTQKAAIDNAMLAMQTPYYQWFNEMLTSLDFILGHSRIAANAVNMYNFIMGMMSEAPGGTASNLNLKVFYALKHAFDAPVADSYKYTIQNMYIKEMALAENMHGFELNMSFEKPELNVPDFNMSADEKMATLKNMSQEDIFNTIQNIENYNSSRLTSKINRTLPVIENTSNNMSMVNDALSSLVDGMHFVYNTTGKESVLGTIAMYSNISEMIKNASGGLDEFTKHISYLTGFSYMMGKLSSQFNNMFSKDFNGRHAKAAIMLVILKDIKNTGETDAEHSAHMEHVEESVANVAKSVKVNGEVRVMGSYLISKATEKTSNETMNVLLPISLILVIIILVITFRSAVDTLLGILGLGMAIMWAYGFGVMMNYDFNQISTMVAVLLVGLGIDYAIHTILRYREELRKGKSVRDSMRDMIANLGMGLILATVTTMVSFLSNISSPIPPIQDFGVMNAVGIFGAFIIFTTFVPAVKILIDTRKERKGTMKIKKEEERVGSGVILLNRFMALSAVGAEKHRYGVIVTIAILTGASLYAGMFVSTTFDMKDFLPSNLEISHTIDYMMDNFNSSGMSNNYVLIEGNITSPQALKAVEDTTENMKDDVYILHGQSENIITEIKEWSEKNSTFAKMVSQSDVDGDGIPDKNITEIYNWLYENGDGKDILHLSDGKYDAMIMIIRTSASSNSQNGELIKEVENDIKPLHSAGLTAIFTGTNVLTYHILSMLTGSQWNSMVITIVTTLIVLTIVFYYEAKSYVLGIIASLPVLIALSWLLGSMYLLGISFNVVTVITTSLTIGLGITYAIHITHRFLEDLKNEKNIESAMRKTVRQTGSSIFGAATTTMAGFGTLMLSTMPPISDFGEVSTLSILYSFVLSVFILPSFLYVWAERRENKFITIENEQKYRALGVSVLFFGVLVYLTAYYLRWIGWRIIAEPSSLLVALTGAIIIVAGFEIYYRAHGKL